MCFFLVEEMSRQPHIDSSMWLLLIISLMQVYHEKEQVGRKKYKMCSLRRRGHWQTKGDSQGLCWKRGSNSGDTSGHRGEGGTPEGKACLVHCGEAVVPGQMRLLGVQLFWIHPQFL